MILVDLERVGTKRPSPLPMAWDALERVRLVGLTERDKSIQGLVRNDETNSTTLT